MKMAAMTMVYQDYQALTRWVKHFGGLFGNENLYVISHGGDDKHDEIAEGCNMMQLPRNDMKRFDFVRSRKLANIRRRIEDAYDVVFQLDADELLFFDPRHTFTISGEAVFALGMNVYPEGVRFSGHFSKAVATWGENTLNRHGVQFPCERDYVPEVSRGLYLVHTKYTYIDELIATNLVRKNIVDNDVESVTDFTWKNPQKTALRRFAELETLPWGEWDDEVERLFQTIVTQPKVLANARTVVAPHYESDARVNLPEWIRF
jgi:hypothetical protein